MARDHKNTCPNAMFCKRAGLLPVEKVLGMFFFSCFEEKVANSWSKLTIEALEQGAKYGQT